MICCDPDFLEKVRQAAEINRRAGGYVARSPFSSVLRNMSAPPRTQVSWRLDSVMPTVVKSKGGGPRIVGFELPEGYSIDRSPGQLENAWEQYRLTGAALVFPWRRAEEDEDPRAHRKIAQATDLTLILNVLGRARGGMLSARAELVLEPGFLQRSLYSDDPRLCRLASRVAR